jgi:hypothetical protein
VSTSVLAIDHRLGETVNSERPSDKRATIFSATAPADAALTRLMEALLRGKWLQSFGIARGSGDGNVSFYHHCLTIPHPGTRDLE